MRYRLTVSDSATGVRSDVVVECEPSDPTGLVLDMIGSALPVGGRPTVHGMPVDPSAPMASSTLREGAVVEYGGPGSPDRDPFAGGGTGGFGLRVVSGPSAGLRVGVADGAVLEIGRASTCSVTLADVDVSRRHAVLRSGPSGFELTDVGSANGVFVDGRRLHGSHPFREGEVAQLGASRLVLEHGDRTAAVLTRSPDGAYLLNRRFPDRREPFTAPAVTLPTPLPEDETRGIPLLAMLLPLVLAGAMALFLHSPLYLLFGLLSPIMLGGNFLTERRRRRTRDARQQGSYGDKLVEAQARIETAVDNEDADLRLRMPDPVTVARTALELRRDLWSRRPGDDGWLRLRVGVADRPASVQVSGERPAGWVDPVLRAVPVGVDLEEIGVLGLAGPSGWTAARLAWLLTQCAVLHASDELRIAVLAPDVPEDVAGWSRWLPHTRTADGSVLAAWDDAGTDQLVRGLGSQVERALADRVGPQQKVVGQVLVVLLGAGTLVRRPQVADLLARGGPAGLRFVCVEHDERLLPDSCRAVFVDHGGRSVLRVDRGAELTVAPDELPPGAEDRIARILAPLRRVGDAPAGGLPDAVRFTEVVDVPTSDDLRAAWRLSPERAEIVLGRDGDGLFTLDIARDGPHAVVAGTSGAGKSELLQTWVGALALANSPQQLSVVFMDYKGGAAFRDLVALPHVVGTVTNLDERLAVRALSSLRAELTRRQHQLQAANASDRADYLRRAAADPALPPFPRLMVIVDELAELKDHLPMLVDGLVAVARIGRSLGVHLVLATQKPGGVVDSQIRANVNLRICLRTRDEGESMDVIEVGDAARIPTANPGRALVGRGGQAPSLVQTARITTPCETGTGVLRRAVPVHWTAPAAPRAAAGESGLRTDLHHVVDVVVAASTEEGLAAPYLPWTPPLPEVVLLDALLTTPGHLLLGLCDRPEAQRQDPLEIELGSGHVGIFGSGRTGRTSALRAIAAGIARSHPPTSVHLHAVDGARGLAGLAALPHVGVVADDDDPERLERLLTRLSAEVRRRRQLLAAHGASTTAELGASAPPAIVLLVDDWSGVLETDGVGPAALQELLSGGASAAGVTVCVTGDERLMRGRLLNRLDHRLCLRLNDPSQATALGLSVRNLPDGLPPGRGLWAESGSEVQVPLLAPEPNGPAQAAALRALAAAVRDGLGDPAGDNAPMRLDPLPSRIGWAAASALPELTPGDVLVGVAGDRLSAVRVPLGTATGPVLVAGPPRSGRSTTAASIALDAARAGRRTLLVAPRPGDAHRAAEAHGAVLVAPADLAAALDGEPPDVVVVDDADTAGLDDAVVARLTGAGGPALVVGALLDAFGFGSRGLVQEVKRNPGPVVLLCPPNHLGAENVAVKIERGAGFAGPAGRAVISVYGQQLLGQVPDPTEE